MTVTDEFTTITAKPTPPLSVLRGPADADHYRVRVGRFNDRWYSDPLPSCPIADTTEAVWPSISTVKKASGQDWSFVAVKRIAMSDELTEIGKLQPAARHERVRTIDKLERDAAFKRGSNVHLIAEAQLYGQPCPIGPNDPGYNYRTAINAFFNTYQPELVAAEFVTIHRTLNGVGYGGTSDALIRIDNKLYLVDWKSRGEESNHGGYPEEAAQVAGYAAAEYIIVEGPNGPERDIMPPIDGGLIVSIKPDGYEIYPVDITKGFEHWEALHAWWVARREERVAVGRKWAPRKNSGQGQQAVEATYPDKGSDSTSDAAGNGCPAGTGVVGRAGAQSTPPTEAAADPDRRLQLLERYRLFNDDDKRRFLAHGVDHDDLDTVQAALDAVDPFLAPYPPAPPSPVTEPPPAPPSPPDEGDPVDDNDFLALSIAYARLDEPAQAWLKALIVDGSAAGVDWRAQHHHTQRRYQIYRGLIALAAAGPVWGNNDTVRDILAGVAWSAPYDTLVGALLGQLNATQAANFAQQIDQYLALPTSA